MMLTGAVRPAISTGDCGDYASCGQDSSNTLHVLLAIGGIVLLVAVAWVIQQTVADGRLAKRGTDAAARIKEVTAKAGSRRSNSEVAVYLSLEIPRPDGTSFTAEISAGVSVLEPPKAGWTVPVRYVESKGSFLPRVEIRGRFEPPAVEPAPSSSPDMRQVTGRPPTADQPPAVDRAPAGGQTAAHSAVAVHDSRDLPAVKPLSEADPRRLGGFEVLGRIGSGGMGVVYLGRSRGGRLAAVKVVRSELADDAEFRARFGREIVAARQVSGAFTAPVLDADPDAGQPWLATLFIDAPSLRARVGADGPLPPEEVRALGAGLAEALGDLHRVGLVHRDVKPGNVLLAADGPRLIDFGIIRSDGLADLTESGIVLGSAGYLAPEQAEGEPAGPPADVFSLGAVLTFAATGHGPYGTGSAATLLARTVTGEPDLADLPEGLRELVARCLARDPADRPGTETVLDALAR